jgi:hypothetical protein
VTRVLRGTFHRDAYGSVTLTEIDARFMHDAMARDDLALITKGLVKAKEVLGTEDPFLILRYAEKNHHRSFNLFTKEGNGRYAERHRAIKMTGRDFASYLTLWKETTADPDSLSDAEKMFSWSANELPLDVTKNVLYMTDLSLEETSQPILDRLKLQPIANCMPGGKFCLLKYLRHEARPYMGPDIFLGVPGAYTRFHVDGAGTVDSGHWCISGFNEVIMFRKLPEKKQADLLRFLGVVSPAANMKPHDWDECGEVSLPIKWKRTDNLLLTYRQSSHSIGQLKRKLIIAESSST